MTLEFFSTDFVKILKYQI